jgi:tetratricopeptide (TPR) repeat protein
LAESALAAGQIEMIARNPAGAEQVLTRACQALRAMGERGYLCSMAAMLAEALYAQGRLDEAQQLAEEAQEATTPGDVDAQARWRMAKAKLLARRGQFATARQLADDAMALISATAYAVRHAEALEASAEVARLAGALQQAEASLRHALRIYEDGRATALAGRAKAALASLAVRPGTGPA